MDLVIDDIQFQNMDSWRGGSSGKFGLTFKQIILQHINRCVINGSVEWHGGYWEDKLQVVGQGTIVEKRYVQNSRDIYSNSVKMLRALLLGYFDEEMRKTNKELNEEYSKQFNEYSEKGKRDKEIKNEWYDYKVNWHIKLFEHLIMLSKRLNFFEEEISEEEI